MPLNTYRVRYAGQVQLSAVSAWSLSGADAVAASSSIPDAHSPHREASSGTVESTVTFAVNGQKRGPAGDEVDTAGHRFVNLDARVPETAIRLSGMFLSSIIAYTDRTTMVGRTP